MEISQKNKPPQSWLFPFIKTADLYAGKTGILTDIQGPKDTTNIVECMLSAEIGEEYTFPPRNFFDAIGWVLAGWQTYEEAEKTLERVLREIVIDVW